MCPDFVSRAVALQSTELLALRRTFTIRGVLLDVILDQGVAGPAVDGDQDGAGGCSRASVKGDVPN